MIEYKFIRYEPVSNPRLKFYKLYKDGVCFYDEFLEDLDHKYKSLKKELNKIHALMDMVGNVPLPIKKFRHIHPNSKGDRGDIWEFKTDHLRVYVVRQEPDIYIVVGGFKNDQERAIEKVFKQFGNLPEKLKIE